MRLIDADALTNDILRRWNTNDDTDFANKEVWKALEEAPTIDAVPIEKIAEVFGNPPCLYTFDCLEVQGDEFMYDHRGEWCEKNCMHVPCVECWEQFFKAWGERKDDDKSCDTCKHYDKGWDDIICDGCTKADSNWERRNDETD